MNLDKIQYFFKAAELENFSHAAENCHIAQTTMSKFIADLEEELGVKLFIRIAKNVRLTETGKLFYYGMQDIWKSYNELLDKLDPTEDVKTVNIGMITRDYAEFPILRSFEKNRSYKLRFRYEQEEMMIRSFLDGGLDALICPDFMEITPPSQCRNLGRKNLSVSKEVLVYAKELEPIYGSAAAVIRAVPLITKTEQKHFHRNCGEKLRRQFGAEPYQVQVVKEFHQQVLLVNMGKGFAIVPENPAFVCESNCVYPLPEEFDEITQIVYDLDNEKLALQEMIHYISKSMKQDLQPPLPHNPI